MRQVVITGIGMVTPLGNGPSEVIGRIRRGDSAVQETPFDTSAFDCSLYAPILDFDAEEYFSDNKTLRMMNRDAQLAVVAAEKALNDAAIKPGETYPSERIALYGATGMASLPMEEIAPLVQTALGDDGELNLQRFGSISLKRVRPVLSFKILANMPICFVSIFCGLRGPNAVFTPWEGNGAQAIITAIRAIERGETECAIAGGCDVKTRSLSYVSLQQLGVFDGWKNNGRGCTPGEGAAFIVLEEAQSARRRGAHIYARMIQAIQRAGRSKDVEATRRWLWSRIEAPQPILFASGSGQRITDIDTQSGEIEIIRPKESMGDLFAGAAAVQVGLAAEGLRGQKSGRQAIACCFGYGAEQALFVLEAA